MSGLWTKMGSPHPQPPKKNQKRKRGRVSQVNPLQKLDLYYLSRRRKKDTFPINQYLN